MQIEDMKIPQGFYGGGVKAGIKKSGKEDVAVLYSKVPANGAAVFTTNTMAAAPVVVSRRVVQNGKVQAIVVNSGCANACTGVQGQVDAQAMAHQTAGLLNVAQDEVIVASTGVIGVPLPMGKISAGIKSAVEKSSADGFEDVKLAMMTTDTFPKTCSVDFTLGGKPVRIAGLAKGSGMIHPNMATMLCFIMTDADIEADVLQTALKHAVDQSFHRITVDGDSSTNDMVAVLANALAGNAAITKAAGEDYGAFLKALTAVCIHLAKLVARDGEGATKFLEITVQGATSEADAHKAAMAIAKSPLVKTAFFGQDPNWGRILCAVGYSEAAADPEKVSLTIGGLPVVKEGQGVADQTGALKDVMAEHDINVVVDLGVGSEAATVWTCDFSYEYVKINGEYHT
ncbi:bifunctional glutamate N-acetyltransferase/amino-acid acetyltransferase ArgJ [Azotosporobacter soli]|uniref:bifunctional glutamate N-acetyltransferase/amino-acid acetyltransferase ArgJ n=1 Tax=Azotosporobacter soli TaxID=3055040 RepID=UPI003D160903